MTFVGALGIGLMSKVASTMAYLSLSKTAIILSVHGGKLDEHFVYLRRECSGCKIVAPPDMNLWYKFNSLRNCCKLRLVSERLKSQKLCIF